MTHQSVLKGGDAYDCADEIKRFDKMKVQIKMKGRNMKPMKFSLLIVACLLGLFVAYLSAAPTVLSDKQAELRLGSKTCGPCNWTMDPETCEQSSDAQGDCIATYAPGCGGDDGEGSCEETTYVYCKNRQNCNSRTGYTCQFEEE